MKDKHYTCLRLHKDDLRAEVSNMEIPEDKLLDKIDKLTDAQMEALAKKIGEACCENETFWNCVNEFMEELSNGNNN